MHFRRLTYDLDLALFFELVHPEGRVCRNGSSASHSSGTRPADSARERERDCPFDEGALGGGEADT